MSNKGILSQDDDLQNSSLPKKTNLLKKLKKTDALEKQKKKPLCSSPLISDFDEENDESTFSSLDYESSEESVGYSHSEGFGKVKLLPPSVLKDIEQKNLARKLAGLAPILVRVRRCLACGSSFQSSGNRTCGCASRSAGTIAGREII